MLSVAHQLDQIQLFLQQSGGEIVADPCIDVDDVDETGVLEMALRYPNGYQLHVHLTMDIAAGHPDWVYYSLHLLDSGGRFLMRCDNNPHHPDLDTFPDHRHVNAEGNVQNSARPSMRTLVMDIRKAVGNPS